MIILHHRRLVRSSQSSQSGPVSLSALGTLQAITGTLAHSGLAFVHELPNAPTACDHGPQRGETRIQRAEHVTQDGKLGERAEPADTDRAVRGTEDGYAREKPTVAAHGVEGAHSLLIGHAAVARIGRVVVAACRRRQFSRSQCGPLGR